MSDADKPNPPAEIDETLPDIVKHFLRKGYQLEDIHLDQNGRWFHRGEVFENEKLIALFSRSVGRTEGGTWILEVGPFTYPIRVDDTGFFVERLLFDRGKSAAPLMHLSDQTTERLDVATLTYEPEGRLYCTIRQGAFRARFLKPAYYALSDYFVERDAAVWLEIGGAHQRLI